MKVIMINGSRREQGCTYTALSLVARALNEEGIDTEIIFVGKDSVNGNIDELVKEVGEKVKEADGLVLGSPVYYAHASGEILAFLDRLFWKYGKYFRLKPGACVVSARRAGTSASLDSLNKYLTIAEMPVVSSCYWNMVHGSKPEDVLQDEEGVQVMETLGRNMAFMLKCFEAGRKSGVKEPEPVKRIFTNFIR